MRIYVPDYYKQFQCIASACEDTCCAGWEIVIDEETYNKYQSMDGELGNRIRSEIIHRDGENIFRLKGNDCTFLNENKLCDICAVLGDDGLCHTCRQFPRYTEEFGDLREIGISLSCPEAARIMLRDSKKVVFETSETEEEISSYHDIDAMLFIYLLQCRKIILELLQDRSIDLEKRICCVVKFADEIQQRIDKDDIQGIKAVYEKYQAKAYIDELVHEFDRYHGNGSAKYKHLHEFFKFFKGLKHIHPNDPLGLEDVLSCYWQYDGDEQVYSEKHKQFNEYYADRLYQFEHLMVYFVFRYFMKAVFDYEVSAKVKAATISCIMIKELLVFRWMKTGQLTLEDAVDIMHMYSKDIEHLEENIETLEQACITNEAFGSDELYSILMNQD